MVAAVTPPGPAPETQSSTFADFTGGLNLISDTFKLGPNESPHMLNVDVHQRGGIQRRRGWTEVATMGQTRGWGMVGDQTAGDHMIFQTEDDELWYWDGGTPVQLILDSGTDTATAVTVVNSGVVTSDDDWVENCIHWSTFDYVGYGFRGDTTTPRATVKYDATGVEAGTNSSITTMTDPSVTSWQDDFDSPSGVHMPVAKFGASHLEYMFVGHPTENSTHMHNRIRWSHPGDAGSWRENDYIDIEPGHDGDHVVALIPFREQLVVLKADSVYVLTGYSHDTFQVIKVADGIGAVSPYAVAANEQGVFFFDRHEGLFVYDGQKVSWLFEKIHPALLDGSIESVASTTVAVLGRRVWVNCRWNDASNTDAGRSFIFDLDVGAWTCYTGFTETGDTAPNNHIRHAFMYASDGVNEKPYAELAYNYSATDKSSLCHVDIDGTYADTITSGPASGSRETKAVYRSSWIDLGDAARDKRWRRPEFVLSGGYGQTTTVKVFKDWNASTASKTLTIVTSSASGSALWDAVQWGSFSWSQAADLFDEVVRGGAIGSSSRSVMLEFTGPDDGNAWEMNAFILKWRNKRLKG